MAESESGEKTEAPSGKRLDDARNKGQIAKSPELTTAAFLLGSTLTMTMAGPPLWQFLLDTMGNTLARSGGDEFAILLLATACPPFRFCRPSAFAPSSRWSA